ncbi:hypothetical protein LSCM4_05545 [Leishmania orientalis]|uniref:Uncharacterized protein n=1 Tax=Leishmania orientalis TaxID=2249476 RepID=A0A836GHU7_9TRYP|nr:hypothetical protein LSCM4_05545 [Leishmania orientalis]
MSHWCSASAWQAAERIVSLTLTGGGSSLRCCKARSAGVRASRRQSRALTQKTRHCTDFVASSQRSPLSSPRRPQSCANALTCMDTSFTSPPTDITPPSALAGPFSC